MYDDDVRCEPEVAVRLAAFGSISARRPPPGIVNATPGPTAVPDPDTPPAVTGTVTAQQPGAPDRRVLGVVPRTTHDGHLEEASAASSSSRG